MSQQHIFVSYSRADSQIAHQIAQDLERSGFDVWIDIGDLTPGTQNWEDAIRAAIDHAFAVVLIASPSSRQSTYVQGELAVARVCNCPVYPVWVSGYEWINCIPLGMVNYQYVDCRPDDYSQGITDLVNSLQVFIQTPEQVVEVVLPTYEVARLGANDFDTSQNMLNYLFMNYLIDWYEPLSYGIDWLLVNLETKRIAMPWAWLTLPVGSREPLRNIAREWGDISPQTFGFEAGSRWGVWEASRVHAVGIATNIVERSDTLLSAYGSRELMLLLSNQSVKPVKPGNVDPTQYKSQWLMAVFGTTFNKVVFVDTD